MRVDAGSTAGRFGIVTLWPPSSLSKTTNEYGSLCQVALPKGAMR
jgi:hypothetical protein